MRAALILIPLCFLSDDDSAKQAIERAKDSVEAVWPKSVPMPPGMAWYTKTRYTQRLANTNGADTINLYRLDQHDFWQNSPPSFNPNVRFPWAVSGGLHNVEGWRSRAAVFIPKGKYVYYWRQRVPVKDGGMLPAVQWQWPVGTQFADILSTDRGVFEVRVNEKKDDGWHSNVVFEEVKARPEGYVSAKRNSGKTCFECHSRAGAAEQYGISNRGKDFVFSAFPFKEGTFVPDLEAWPIKHWND